MTSSLASLFATSLALTGLSTSGPEPGGEAKPPASKSSKTEGANKGGETPPASKTEGANKGEETPPTSKPAKTEGANKGEEAPPPTSKPAKTEDAKAGGESTPPAEGAKAGAESTSPPAEGAKTGGETPPASTSTSTAGTEAGGETPPASTTTPTAGTEPGSETPPATTERKPWIHRHPPTAGMVEVGVFGGAWFPSRRLELFEPDDDLPNGGNQRLPIAVPEVGLRAGYYPLQFFGVELEGAVLPTRTQSTDTRATAWAFRGNVVGQLGLWSVTPFVLGGLGVLGVSSEAVPVGLGRDADFDFHFGAGVKVFVTDYLQLRLEGRNVITNRAGIAEGLTSSPEVLLGVTWALRIKKPPKEERRPPPDVPVDDDQDDDTILDPNDRCVDEPETFNDYEDDDGCPDEIPPELDEVVGIIEGIYFDNDMDVIRPESQPVLDHAVEVLKRHPSVKVQIIGHTSSTGGFDHNMDLSRRRADSVRRYLVEHGIDQKRLTTKGVGPTQPRDTNETEQGRARNRRIEFRVAGSIEAIEARPGEVRGQVRGENRGD